MLQILEYYKLIPVTSVELHWFMTDKDWSPYSHLWGVTGLHRKYELKINVDPPSATLKLLSKEFHF